MSNRELPFMPWYPDQFEASTRAWTWLERALYRALLDVQWQLGGLPTDPERVRLSVGFPETEFRTAWPIVSEKFKKGRGGLLVNERAEYHKNESLKRKDHMATIGAAGGKASAQARASRRAEAYGAQTAQQGLLHPPSPSPSEEEEPHTPQSGASRATHNGTRAAGNNPRALGTDPRSNGTNPRAQGTNPRAVAKAEEWEKLTARATASGFRAPYQHDTPDTYETSLKLHERDHPRP
jgi:uncharacterized protein YdaU (DUF1376 family)